MTESILWFFDLRTHVGVEPDQVSSAWHSKVLDPCRVYPVSHEYVARAPKVVVSGGEYVTRPLLGRERAPQSPTNTNKTNSGINYYTEHLSWAHNKIKWIITNAFVVMYVYNNSMCWLHLWQKLCSHILK